MALFLKSEGNRPMSQRDRTARAAQPALTLLWKRLARGLRVAHEVALGNDDRQFPGHAENQHEKRQKHHQTGEIGDPLEQVGDVDRCRVTSDDKYNKDKDDTHRMSLSGTEPKFRRPNR